jgi:predicted NAD/FAD-binding protein
MIRLFQNRIHLASPVKQVQRISGSGVEVRFEERGQMQSMVFDDVVMASHSDQTLGMLVDASPMEREVLSGFSYQPNSTLLHTDVSVLPKRKLAWAAWNYFVPRMEKDHVAVSYNMNVLQGIRSPETFVVSLNMDDQIRPDRILARLNYHHPVFTDAAFRSQKRWAEISGKNGVHFCGAYWGYGFHEDGVKSALKVGQMFGESLKGSPS